MKRMLFNATYAEELRVAAVDGQKLINFDIETSSKEQRRGNIYKGFVTRVEPSLEACFVDYGTDKQGFLPFKEIDFRYLPEVNGHRGRDFSKLPLGTELIVQVEKDERGNKGAALTTYITLPGRYLVLMPNNSRSGGISRRIEGEERDELKNLMTQLDIPHGMSVILRTAALGRVVEELQWDLTYLTRLWEMIVAASKEKGAFLIYLESSLVIRSIRDHFSPDISEILIDTEDVYQQACKFMSLVMPNFADRIKFYRDDVPLFSRFQIEHQIESAYSRTVTLPSGGVIVIDHTEALTAVDVNSAKANKGADIETTAFLTNLEAAEELSRQLRLRDLGGLVVVDFIDMENPRNQRDLENHFKTQLSLDRARIQMGKLSKFGLLELSRQRLQTSLDEASGVTCPRCAGVGTIRGIESSALHLLRIIQEEVIKNSGHLSALHVQLPVDVGTYLLNERREDVAKIEARMKVKIVLIPNVHLNSPQHKIKKLTYDTYDSSFNRSSYSLVEAPEENLGYKTAQKKSDSQAKTPMVKEVTHQEPAPVVVRTQTSFLGGLFKKIGAWFAPAPVKSKPARNNRNQNARNNKNRAETLNGSSFDKNVKPTKDNNRTRPVTVAKSNNKVQTVRQVNNNLNAKNQPDEREQNTPRGQKEDRRIQATNNNIVDNVETPVVNNANARKLNTAKNIAAASTANSRTNDATNAKDNGAQQSAKPARQHPRATENRRQLDNTATEKVVQNVAAAVEAVVASNVVAEVASQLEKPITPATPLAAMTNPVSVEEINLGQQDATTLVKPVPEVVVETVTVAIEPEVIDLGGMELVSTNQELVKQVTDSSDDYRPNVKRYSDIVIEEKVVETDIQFELVETKK